MIFLFIIPILAGFGNYIVPLQIGALDMAFPRVNALSFWMLPLAGIVLFSSYFLGGPADAGWTQYAPLSEGVGARATRSAPTCGSSPCCWSGPPPSWARSTSSPPSSTCGRRA